MQELWCVHRNWPRMGWRCSSELTTWVISTWLTCFWTCSKPPCPLEWSTLPVRPIDIPKLMESISMISLKPIVRMPTKHMVSPNCVIFCMHVIWINYYWTVPIPVWAHSLCTLVWSILNSHGTSLSLTGVSHELSFGLIRKYATKIFLREQPLKYGLQSHRTHYLLEDSNWLTAILVTPQILQGMMFSPKNCGIIVHFIKIANSDKKVCY